MIIPAIQNPVAGTMIINKINDKMNRMVFLNPFPLGRISLKLILCLNIDSAIYNSDRTINAPLNHNGNKPGPGPIDP
jgi:hypothetical protein